ncbi:MAG: hypothetical protein ACLTX3_08600 [Lachnospiraceae bacterium]
MRQWITLMIMIADQYDHCCAKNEYPSIEIEVHQDDGRIAEVITVD